MPSGEYDKITISASSGAGGNGCCKLQRRDNDTSCWCVLRMSYMLVVIMTNIFYVVHFGNLYFSTGTVPVRGYATNSLISGDIREH